MLGVTHNADKDEVHHAYQQLAKIYHPDRYDTFDLPPEVREYLEAMARRVNAAHEALIADTRDKPATPAKQEPVFTTTGRS